MRVDPSSLNQLMHYQISPEAIKKSKKLGNFIDSLLTKLILGRGLNASPGAASG